MAMSALRWAVLCLVALAGASASSGADRGLPEAPFSISFRGLPAEGTEGHQGWLVVRLESRVDEPVLIECVWLDAAGEAPLGSQSMETFIEAFPLRADREDVSDHGLSIVRRWRYEPVSPIYRSYREMTLVGTTPTRWHRIHRALAGRGAIEVELRYVAIAPATQLTINAAWLTAPPAERHILLANQRDPELSPPAYAEDLPGEVVERFTPAPAAPSAAQLEGAVLESTFPNRCVSTTVVLPAETAPLPLAEALAMLTPEQLEPPVDYLLIPDPGVWLFIDRPTRGTRALWPGGDISFRNYLMHWVSACFDQRRTTFPAYPVAAWPPPRAVLARLARYPTGGGFWGPHFDIPVSELWPVLLDLRRLGWEIDTDSQLVPDTVPPELHRRPRAARLPARPVPEAHQAPQARHLSAPSDKLAPEIRQ